MKLSIKVSKPGNKRYGIYFRSWWNNYMLTEKDYIDNYWKSGLNGLTINESFEYFDLLSEAEESAFLYNEVYQSTPQPILVEKYKDKYGNNIPKHYLFSGGSKFWGYAVLDYQECKILRVYGDLKKESPWNLTKRSIDYLELLDKLFRKPDEIPENYKWDEGEYLGWLQFRWGNGLNSINKKDIVQQLTKKFASNNEKFSEISPNDDLLDLEDKFSKDIEKERKVRKQNHW